MGTVFVLAGSILGLFAAILLFTLFGVGLPVALAVWVLSGPVAALVAIAIALRPTAPPAEADARAKAA
jgi:hypothetical protein